MTTPAETSSHAVKVISILRAQLIYFYGGVLSDACGHAASFDYPIARRAHLNRKQSERKLQEFLEQYFGHRDKELTSGGC